MNQRENKFTIKAVNKAKALEALKDAAYETDKMSGFSTIGGKQTKHFSWVDMNYVKCKILEDALPKCRWDIYTDTETGDVSSIEFNGEKFSGDEITILSAIAPFVESGSFIEMQGEEGERWRWIFNGKTCKEIYANIRW